MPIIGSHAVLQILTGKTKFSLKFGLRSAKLSALGEQRRWLRSSGKRQILETEKTIDDIKRITIKMLGKKFELFGSRESEVFFIFCEGCTSE